MIQEIKKFLLKNFRIDILSDIKSLKSVFYEKAANSDVMLKMTSIHQNTVVLAKLVFNVPKMILHK